VAPLSGKITRVGRPSNAEVIRREAQARRSAMSQLIRALQHLNHPSRLSESPLCQLDGVKRQEAMLRGYRYPRAHVVIQAVRRAYDLAWAELGRTEDARCLIALADALEGVSREVSAHKTGVSFTEISRRRREAVDMIIDHVLALLQGERSLS
jgi:hypothetical protein